MKKYVLLSGLCFLLVATVMAQSPAQSEIQQLLRNQTVAWNKGDIDGFMVGYWNSDSLMFVGKDGVTYGYANTLQHYKNTYNTADKMGRLSFDVLKVNELSNDFCFIVGKWFLHRNAGDINGHFTLLFRKLKGRWVIVCDHSS